MKEFKSFVIGFLTCACLFLIMGQTDKTEKNIMEDVKTLLIQNGRFQVTTIVTGNGHIKAQKIYTTVIDTRTGEIVQKTKTKLGNYDK